MIQNSKGFKLVLRILAWKTLFLFYFRIFYTFANGKTDWFVIFNPLCYAVKQKSVWGLGTVVEDEKEVIFSKDNYIELPNSILYLRVDPCDSPHSLKIYHSESDHAATCAHLSRWPQTLLNTSMMEVFFKSVNGHGMNCMEYLFNN